MKKFFDVEICEVINGESANDIWDSDALYEPFEAETGEDAIEEAIYVIEDKMREYSDWAYINKDNIEIHNTYGKTRFIDINDINYNEKKNIINDETYNKTFNSIAWKDLNGEEHIVLFRAKEAIE